MLTCKDFPEVECCEICHAGGLLDVEFKDMVAVICCHVAFGIRNHGREPPGKEPFTEEFDASVSRWRALFEQLTKEATKGWGKITGVTAD